MGAPPDTKARTAMRSPNGFCVGYVEDRHYESACSLPHVTYRDPWLGCCRHVGSDGPHTHAKRYLPQLRSLHSDSCVHPHLSKALLLLPPILDGQEEKSLAAHVFPQLLHWRRPGRHRSSRGLHCDVFPRDRIAFGLPHKFLHKVISYFSGSQLINLRTRFPAGEAYVHTLDIAAAWYGFRRMKSFGKTPSWLHLLWLGLQIKQHLQRWCLHGFPGTEEHIWELAKPRPSSHVRRHPTAVQPASALSLSYPFLKPGVTYPYIANMPVIIPDRMTAWLGLSHSHWVLLPFSKTACFCWWPRGEPMTVSPETRLSMSWSLHVLASQIL